MANLNFHGLDRMYQISYDEFGDVLYVKSDESHTARKTIVDDDGFMWRFGTFDAASPAGFTVFDFSYNWQNKSHQLADRIETGMAWNKKLAKKLTCAILFITADRRKVDEEIFSGLPESRPVTSRAAR